MYTRRTSFSEFESFDTGRAVFKVKDLNNALKTAADVVFFAKLMCLTRKQFVQLLYALYGTFNKDYGTHTALEGDRTTFMAQESMGRAVAKILEGCTFSTELQGYMEQDLGFYELSSGTPSSAPPEKVSDTLLTMQWDLMELEIAHSIQKVGNKLHATLGSMPGREMAMFFEHTATMNRRRPTLGDYRATFKYTEKAPNLVILDVSGSIGEKAVKAVAEEVVSLGYKADAHLALVSTSTLHWEPGTYSVRSILESAEYGGTQYESLAPLFHNRDWETVVTMADYDGYSNARDRLSELPGSIEKLVDISLVRKPTHLAMCLESRAKECEAMSIYVNDNLNFR